MNQIRSFARPTPRHRDSWGSERQSFLCPSDTISVRTFLAEWDEAATYEAIEDAYSQVPAGR